jgi:hypothetical protein
MAIFTTATLRVSCPLSGSIQAQPCQERTSGFQSRERRQPYCVAPAVQAQFGLLHGNSSVDLRAAPSYGPRAIYRFYSQLRQPFGKFRLLSVRAPNISEQNRWLR